VFYTKYPFTVPALMRAAIGAGAIAFAITSMLVPLSPGRAQPPAAPPPVPDAATIDQGAALALIGNCNVCHTAPGGKSYTGGRVRTPFGVMYAPNITPDPDTGIGRWSEAAFVRAMHEGVDAEGRELYPAFPYDHYTRVGADDVRALYAFLMTRDPVRAERLPNELRFPYNIRPLVRVWKLMYLRHEPFVANAAHDAQWNRGAYLVEGLGHCGACHTPRNALGAEKKRESLEGGESEGWRAPPLTAASPSPARWTADALAAYLRTGIADDHEIAAGPMAPVVHNLALVREEDVRAIAVYIASIASAPGDAAASTPRAASPAPVANPSDAGAVIYDTACAHCHDDARGESSRAALPLERSTSVALDSPDNLIRIVRDGIVPDDDEAGRWMPGFAGALNDAQITSLTSYVRTRFAHAPAWPDVARNVARIRSEERR